jgi:hypothetical protein
MKKFIYWLFGKPITTFDTGLRGDKYGNLYVDKKVFYLRKDVRKNIEDVKNSIIIRKMIEKHK